MELNKNTVWSMSLATMITFVGAIWMASGFVQDKIGIIDANASGISSINMKRAQDNIRDLQRDLRRMESELRNQPGNEYLIRDISATKDDIEHYKGLLDCLRKGRKDCD